MLVNKMECKLRHPCELTNDREAAHCVGRHSLKIPEQLAAETGIRLKRFMRITAPSSEYQAYPSEVAAITRATGRFEWLRFYVRAAGCELFTLPTIALDEPLHELLPLVSASATAFSDLLRELERSAADRVITRDECDALDARAGELFARAKHLIAAAQMLYSRGRKEQIIHSIHEKFGVAR